MSSYSEKMLAALKDENLTEANLMFEEALKKDDPEILASLAEELQALGFIEEAKRVLEKLLKDFPEEDVFYLSLAEIAIEDDLIDDAFEYLEKIKPESENYLESLLVTADLYQVLGIPEVSEAKLLQAKTIAPEEPLITFALAELHFSANQLGEAINDYGQLQKQGIDEIANISIDERIGSAYSMMGGFEEAIPFLERALEKEHTSDRLFQLGFTYYQLHDHQKAINYLQELITIDPQYQSGYYYLADSLKEEELLEEALTAAEEGVKENPYQVELLHMASEIAYRLRDSKKAEELLLQALETGDKTDETLLTLSNLYLNEEQPDKAIEMISQMDEEDNPYAAWNLAQAYNELEDFDAARTYYKQAYEDLAHEPDFLKAYGIFLREDGQLEPARAVLTNYLQLEPGDLEVQSLLEE
ncbi:tetratricopeptide repeat protein [Enterococcus hulanensis]|uniref:Tetratricopeptide repeat protein n=1 Tax=Enterococcus hulanensis TaxID=2559929 RepID=A0ABU3F581_9ENTE|nr:tetratricopeptide repeat protein [Enterococcus hulanensis]MDT2602279.1 tetratricopeptide repeat protein [Enterococcus hulanensis]MDT2611674.1 tetratricopeptide repeat protein [Enterococcus hulanensis]MDT2618747.1 tetratricopeptide repeat protein [Enterococcus hulanensis]MDT2630351.1 tetratricopeptide repeat protein [Enterococcus hulanensis]MDT2657736.1 tetratricopeptide repeat protein [Enterococcus hulanensis]